MTLTENIRIQLGIVSLWGLLTLVTLLPHTPWLQPVPGRDSGVFLYIGQIWLQGEVPYRDVWDHKPPLVFLIDAVGLCISGGSQWGVWIVQWLMLWTACAVSYSLLKQIFDRVASLVATVGWLTGLSLVTEGGNLTEQYALTFQFAALAMICRVEKAASNWLPNLCIGLFAALAFLLRQNLIGLWIAFGLVHAAHSYLEKDWKAWGKSIGQMLAGFSIVLVLFVGYFTYQGALGAFWDAAFHYNFVYSGSSWYDRLWGAHMGLRFLSPIGLHLLLIAGWICAAAQWLAMCRKGDRSQTLFLLLGTAVVGTPIEMGLTGLSGRGYAHYYMTWLPMLAVLSACLIHRIGPSAIMPRAVAKQSANTATREFNSPAWAWGLIVAMIFSAAIVVIPRTRVAARQSREAAAIADSIRIATNEGDPVLLWGGEVTMNFVTGRKSPSRFCYQYPLLTNGYRSQALVEEFLTELSENPPTLIIDTSSTNERVPPLDAHDRESSYQPQEKYGPGTELDPVFNFIARNYSWTETVDSSQWRIYRRIGSGTSLR